MAITMENIKARRQKLEQGVRKAERCSSACAQRHG